MCTLTLEHAGAHLCESSAQLSRAFAFSLSSCNLCNNVHPHKRGGTTASQGRLCVIANGRTSATTRIVNARWPLLQHGRTVNECQLGQLVHNNDSSNDGNDFRNSDAKTYDCLLSSACFSANSCRLANTNPSNTARTPPELLNCIKNQPCTLPHDEPQDQAWLLRARSLRVPSSVFPTS